MSKLKIAKYWGAACGGCDVSVVDLDERVLEVVKLADIVFWPVALDFKYSDVEAMGDGEVDITLFNGAVRNTDTKHVAEMLRRKSKVVVAFGSCACFGGIPSLANQSNRQELLELVYERMPSTVNPDRVHPQPRTEVNGHTLELPLLFNRVLPLDQVVGVDYYLPGCPPSTARIWDLVGAAKEFAETGRLPPRGTVFGGDKALCEECPRERHDKRIERIVRIHELEDDGKTCFLEQGVICMGPATRSGCGPGCIKANMPCRGCHGPLPGVMDQGSLMLSALASVMGLEDEPGLEPARAEALAAQVKDPLGTFYQFTLGSSILGGALRPGKGGG